MSDGKHQVVIVGGGFGGLFAAKSLRRAPVEVTLLDRRNYHLFQPLLYQVATGGLSPANIASPLRAILKRHCNVKVLLAEVKDFDVPGRKAILDDGVVPYDSLIVSTGASHNYFGHPEWEARAPGLKSIEDATEIRRRILLAFEAAERETDPQSVRSWLTFVIVGGGPTGVEMAGAVAEIARHTLRHDFRSIDPADARILLVDAADRLLGAYPPELAAKASDSLARLGVTTMTGTMVADIQAESVKVKRNGAEEDIPARTIVWAAGVQASPLGRMLHENAGARLDRAGRVIVEPDLTIPGHPEIFVIGDLSIFTHQTGKPLPGMAPVAMQQGQYAARRIVARLRGAEMKPFHYTDFGSMATIGRASAVADFGWFRCSGYLAWLAWLFIHLMNLVQFQNRLLVFLQWAWNYFTWNRAARLITGASPFPLNREGKKE